MDIFIILDQPSNNYYYSFLELFLLLILNFKENNQKDNLSSLFS